MLAVTFIIVMTSTRRRGSTTARMAPIADSLGYGHHGQTRNVGSCTVGRNSGPDWCAVPIGCDHCLTRIAGGGWSDGKPDK